MSRNVVRSLSLMFLAAGLLLGAQARGESFRLGDDVAPTFQAIRLEVDAERPDYAGQTTIELQVRQPVSSFHFHAEGLTIDRLTLTGSEGEVAVGHAPVPGDRVEVTAEAPLATGVYTLEIAFHNAFGTRALSLYRMEHGGHGYTFTQFEPDDARGAFPCWDEPAFKIPFQMTLTVPAAHLAVSNTPIERESLEGDHRTVVFARTPPLPTYLLAIATGPFETVDLPGLGVPARIVTVKGQSHLTATAVALTPKIHRALEAWFGRPYPYAKLDFIAVPEFWPGAMENPGAITYADRILLVDPENATFAQRRVLARIIAHEIAHQWFGNLVTMRWWDDLWLNESFADWMGDKITDQIHPEFDNDLSAAQNTQNIMDLDARVTTEPIRNEVESTENLLESVGLAYNKGKTVLRMFEQWLGPETFRRGVVDYVNANAWGNATAADLWRALDKASGKNVSAALATFIEQPGLPLVDVELSEDGHATLRQSRFTNYGTEAKAQTWQIPVSFTYPAGGGLVTETVLLDTPTKTIELEGEGRPPWFFPNAGAEGYYRWQLPYPALLELTHNPATRLSARERIEFLGNATALLDAGVIDGGQYLEILAGFGDDPEPLVVSALIGALGRIELAFVPEPLEAPFAAYVRRTLGPSLERFGLEQQPGEKESVSLLRPALIGWLGETGHDERILAHARQLAEKFLADPASIDPAVAPVALRLAAIHGDRKLFEEYKKRFETTEVPALRGVYLAALGSFRDPELRQAGLRYALEGPLRPNEIFTIPQGMTADPATHDLVFRWTLDNYNAIVARIPPIFVSFLPFVASGCSSERLTTAEQFFGQPEHKVPGTEKRLEGVAEQVHDCVNLRAREGEAVGAFLTAGAV